MPKRTISVRKPIQGTDGPKRNEAGKVWLGEGSERFMIPTVLENRGVVNVFLYSCKVLKVVHFDRFGVGYYAET